MWALRFLFTLSLILALATATRTGPPSFSQDQCRISSRARTSFVGLRKEVPRLLALKKPHLFKNHKLDQTECFSRRGQSSSYETKSSFGIISSTLDDEEDEHYRNHHHHHHIDSSRDHSHVQLCSAAASGRSVPATLLRGACLRIASDMMGGTVFENVKCRVTATPGETAGQAAMHLIRQGGGIRALWSGSSSRTVEGALVGAVFMMASTVAKTQMKAMGATPTVAAVTAGLMGGVAQATIMTPAGMIFTSLNVNRGKRGFENDNALGTARRIVNERGAQGFYYGFRPMCIRQATNWASRSGLTEVARSVLGLQKYGILGEIGSGVLGGLGSCWNTPIETIRVCTQRDLSTGRPVKSIQRYWSDIVEEDGYAGLFRGITPRSFQAIYQTCFMVVVPNILGV